MSRLNDFSGTAVHAFGCHVEAEGWESIVWGEAPNKLGRVPLAILIAYQEKAQIVSFGTGASERDGLKESEYTVQYMWEHFEELSAFTEFQGFDLNELRNFMKKVVMVENTSQNTTEEMQAIGGLYAAEGIERVILVSSPTHIFRCHQAALSIFTERYPSLVRGLSARASDTSFVGYGPNDVVIVEPPHRGDLPKYPLHRAVSRIFSLYRKGEAVMWAFIDDLNALLDKYEASASKLH